MTDWSFMKTGNDPTQHLSQPDTSLVKAYASIFLTFSQHGLAHAGNYTVGKGRRVVTVDDIKRGMKYEVFKFMDRDDNLDNIEKWKNIIESEQDDDSDSLSFESELSDVDDNMDGDNDDNDNNDNMDGDNDDICCDNDICDDDVVIDKVFIEEMDNIDSKWEEWVPQNHFESALRERINQM